jgi:hypothetical protein
LFTSFSDYYHENNNDEYKESRNIASDFGNRNLFTGFTEAEWNDYYNFCAQCVQFFLSHPKKINPPMDNVTKRSLRAEMGDAFEGWAEGFFAKEEIDDTKVLYSQYLDNYFSKEMAFDDFMKATKLGKWTTNKFKKAMKAYCQLNDYVMNPKDLHNSAGRIVQKINSKTEEVFYIRTVATPDVAKRAENVTEYSNENDIFEEE